MNGPSKAAWILQQKIFDVDRATGENLKLLMERDQVINKLQQRVDLLEAEKESFVTLQHQIAALKKENKNIDKLKVRTVQLEKENSRIPQLQQQIHHLEREVSNSEKLKQRINQLEKEASSTIHRDPKSDEIVVQLQQQLKIETDTISQLKTQIAHLEGANEQLLKVQEQTSKLLTDEREKVIKLQLEVQHLAQDDEMKRKNENERITLLKQEIENMTRQKQQTDIKEDTVERLKNRIEDFVKENQTLKQKILVLENQMKKISIHQSTTNGDAITDITPDHQPMEGRDEMGCSDGDGCNAVVKPRAKISFFSFKTSRQPAVPERKISFSKKGSLRRSNLHFAPPLNYLQKISGTEREGKEYFTMTFQEKEIRNLKATVSTLKTDEDEAKRMKRKDDLLFVKKSAIEINPPDDNDSDQKSNQDKEKSKKIAVESHKLSLKKKYRQTKGKKRRASSRSSSSDEGCIDTKEITSESRKRVSESSSDDTDQIRSKVQDKKRKKPSKKNRKSEMSKPKKHQTEKMFSSSSESESNVSEKRTRNVDCRRVNGQANATPVPKSSMKPTGNGAWKSSVSSSVLGEYDICDVITEGRDKPAEAKVPPIPGKIAKFLPVSGYYPLGGIGKTGASPIVTTERTARLIPRSKVIMPQKASSRAVETNNSSPLKFKDSCQDERISLSLTSPISGFDKSHEMQRPIFKPAKVSFQKPLSRIRAPVNPVKPQACPAPFVKPVDPYLSASPAIINTVHPMSSVHKAKTIQPDNQRPRTAAVKPTYPKPASSHHEIEPANTLQLSDDHSRSDNALLINDKSEKICQSQPPREAKKKEMEELSHQHSGLCIQPPLNLASEDKGPLEAPIYRFPPSKLSDSSASSLPDSSMAHNKDIGAVQHLPGEEGNSSQALVKQDGTHLTMAAFNRMLRKKVDSVEVGDHGKTFLELSLDSYITDQDQKWAISSVAKRLTNKDSKKFDENVILVRSLLGRLWKCASATVMQSIVKVMATCDPEVVEMRRHILIQYVYVATKDETKWEEVRCLGPSIPPLTVKQMKVFTLLCHLEKEESFSGIIESLFKFVRYNLFSGHRRMHTHKTSHLANISRLYLTFSRMKGDENQARLFLFDALFFKNTRTHVIISVFLDTWPEILQKPNIPGTLEPLAETVVWLVYNTGPPTGMTDSKVYDARNKLRDVCGFSPHPFTGPDFVKYLISLAQANIGDMQITDAITKSLVLMARWKETDWANHNIISRLLDVMRDSGKDETSGAIKEDLLTWVVDTIGYVSRFCSKNNRSNLLNIFESVRGILVTSKVQISPNLENVCLKALIWIGSTLQAQVARFLTEWHPSNLLEPEMESLVRDFVGTRCRTFSDNLIKAIKKKRTSQGVKAIQRKKK